MTKANRNPEKLPRQDASEPGEACEDLSYNQAHTALELILAELQTTDLDVEAMAGLYRRGQDYVHRCQSILAQVEQEVQIWDGLNAPETEPVAYVPPGQNS